jgi:hypothetical protein
MLSLTQLSPVQKLRQNLDAPVEEFCVILDGETIKELADYAEELSETPEEATCKITKILLLYIASIQYIVLSFDDNDYLDQKLIENVDALAKVLYFTYRDICTILITKQIEYLWKTYLKLNETAKKVPTSSTHKIEVTRDRILLDLRVISKRVKGI